MSEIPSIHIDGHPYWCHHHGGFACTCGKSKQDVIDRLTAANEALKGEVDRFDRALDGALATLTSANKEITSLEALNAKYRERFDKIRVTWDCTCDSMGVCPNCIAREALALGEGV